MPAVHRCTLILIGPIRTDTDASHPLLKGTFRCRFSVYGVPFSIRSIAQRQHGCLGAGIRVRGKNCPRPIRTWAQCGVAQKVLAVCKKNGYVTPTPIQSQAIPVIMSGRDMIGVAKTGSGKTLAFLIPVIRHVADQPRSEHGEGPAAVLMTPTRELALQTYNEARRFGKPLNMRCCCVYGGTNISEQIGELKGGADIVVCTVGAFVAVSVLVCHSDVSVIIKKVQIAE